MKLYVSNTDESYKETIIVHLVNPGTEDLLLRIVECWCESKVNEENKYLIMVLYCSHMIYKYYSLFECLPIKHTKEGKIINNTIFKNIPHFIKHRLHVDCL